MNKTSCIIYAPVDTYSGYGSRSRDTIKSIIQLKKEEWDIKIFGCNWGATPQGFIEDNLEEWGFLNEYITLNTSLSSQPDIMIWITIPSEFQKIGKFNIGINAGIETTIAISEWIEGMNKMDLNLVSSEHSKKVYLDTVYQRVNNQTKQPEGVLKLEKPTEVLFEGLNTNIYKYLEINNTKIADLYTIPEDFCYLFVSHWIITNNTALSEDRKNIGLLIKAFFETFKNKKLKPALILKTCLVGSSYIDRDEILKNIQIIRELLVKPQPKQEYVFIEGEFSVK